MKPLNQYPTPETDDFREKPMPTKSNGEWDENKALENWGAFARDLERRLAMCRDALKASQDLMKQLKPLVDKKYLGKGDIFFEVALEDNETALKETEPK